MSVESRKIHSDEQMKSQAVDVKPRRPIEPITDFNANKYMTQQSDSPSKVADESNYVTNEGI